jgi:hypothetical protein
VPWVRKSIRPSLDGLLLEDPDELVADDLALLLGILDTGQPGEEPPPGVDHDELHPEIALEGDAEELRLLLAHQAVVDVDAGQAIADRAVDERCGHGRVHAAGQGADHETLGTGGRGVAVHSLPDPRDGLLDEVGRGPGRRRAGDPDHEVAQHVLALRGVDDLRMELDAVQVAGRRLETGERGRRACLGGRPEAVRQARDRVAVAHPDRLIAVEAGEQPVVVGDGDRRRPVFPFRGRDDVTAELARHQLGAVADPEHRDPARPDPGIRLRSVRVIDRVRAAREDDRLRPAPLDLVPRRVVGDELGIDVQLADAAGDQLGELAAEVEDDDGIGLGCVDAIAFVAGRAGALSAVSR